MSIHASPTPEVCQQLAAQQRRSTINSFIIALFICALITALLYYISIKVLAKNETETITFATANESTSEVADPMMDNEVITKPTQPANSAMSHLLIVPTPSPVSIPNSEVLTEPSLDFGNSSDFSEGGMRHGISSCDNGMLITGGMNKRCSKQDRLQRLAKEGGQASYEDQVVAALRFLKKTQQQDGSWNEGNKPVAMTGLSLLAYLGHCETPASVEFGESAQKAIIYLINVSQKNNGKLTSNIADKHWCYEHAIATYALAEAYTLCKGFSISLPGLEKAVIDGAQFIISNQHSSGAWDYSYDTTGARGGDSSIVCWHLQALKSCKTTKLEILGLEKSAKNALKYLQTCENGKGTIGYTPKSRSTSMSSAAALCLQQWGLGNRSLARSIVKHIDKSNDFDFKTNGDLYQHYYSSQAMINAQGRRWADYNQKTMTQIANTQLDNGAWPAPVSNAVGGSFKTNRHYRTCLCTLMLEVYYRFLPSS